MRSLNRVFCFTVILISAIACETPSDNAIEQARQCSDKVAQAALNNASSQMGANGPASVCITELAGATTAEANQIMFGDYLIEDGLLGNIAQAATAQSSNAGGVDSINSMLLVLIDQAAPSHVTNLINAANGSGSPGMVYVANLISMATTLSTLAGTALTTGTLPASVPTSISSCTGSCATALASSFNTMAAAACAGGGTGNAALCSKATSVYAISGPNPTPAALVSALATFAASSN